MSNAGGPNEKMVNVQILHVNSTETAKMKLAESDTLQHAWDQAYEDLKPLGVVKGPADLLQCAESKDDMASHLGDTLARIRDTKICTNLHFKIIAERGGAIG